MKDGLRFVDSDMHIREPPDLFDRYLGPKFRGRVSVPVGADGRPSRGWAAAPDHRRRRADLRPRPAIPQAAPLRPDTEQPAALGIARPGARLPHFDSSIPHVTENLLKNVPRPVAAHILTGGAHLYGFTEADLEKADAAAAARKP